MEAAVIALLSAMFFASGNVVARLGLLKHASPFSSSVLFVSASAVVWLLVLLLRLPLPSADSLPFYAMRGILDPGLAALFIFVAFRKLGASLTIPIISASALVASALSVIFLGEQLTFPVVAGTLLIVGGVSMLSLGHGRVKGNGRYILAAIAGSFFIGAANVFTKAALNISNTPVSGFGFAIAVGLCLHAVILSVAGKWKELPLSFGKAKVFLVAGLFIAAAFITNFIALSLGTVSVVYPLVSTQSLFALFMSYMLLRKEEVITRNVILGTILVVTGAVFLTVF